MTPSMRTIPQGRNPPNRPERRKEEGMRGKSRIRRAAAILSVLGVVAAACGKSPTVSNPTTPGSTASAPKGSVYDVSLKGICPDKIVLQTDWFPEPEHGGAYNLIGAGGTIDAGKGTYTGPLRNTGVQMEIRAGGPFISFSSPTAQMYSKPDIFVAFADTGDQIRGYKKTPAIGVVAPLEIGPQILMYDPAQYNFTSVSDVKSSGATVLYFESAAFADYLVGTAQLDQKQLDASYDGSPARWVSSGGKVVQQGFATNEPFNYEHNINGWKKPVKFLLLHDAGWKIYQSNIVVRPDSVTKYHDCLAKLVPMWQQSEIDYINNPTAANDVILEMVKEMNTFWVLSSDLNDYADQTMRDLNIVSNGPDSTLGNYDMNRIKAFMDTFVPIEKGKGADIPDDLTPEKIATNEFIDPSIGL
jgi:hypothetical protein